LLKSVSTDTELVSARVITDGNISVSVPMSGRVDEPSDTFEVTCHALQCDGRPPR
jgi:hypothetical protein